jgi:hypothetical protein
MFFHSLRKSLIRALFEGATSSLSSEGSLSYFIYYYANDNLELIITTIYTQIAQSILIESLYIQGNDILTSPQNTFIYILYF